MMTSLRSKLSAFGLRRTVFTLVVLGFLAFFLLQAWRALAVVFVGWFENALGLFEEFEAVHRIHVFTFGLLFWPVVLGLLAQFRSPRKNVSGQLMALVPFVGILLALTLTDFWRPLPIVGMFGTLALVATVLHPAGRELVTSISASRASTGLLALLVIAAVPLVAFAGTQIGLQTGAIEQPAHDHGGSANHQEVHKKHVEAGHYTMTAGFVFMVLGVGLLASLRQDGWWLPALSTGLLIGVFGVVSVSFPETASSAGTLWGIAAILWAVVFVVAAERTRGAKTPSTYGERKATSTPER